MILGVFKHCVYKKEKIIPLLYICWKDLKKWQK